MSGYYTTDPRDPDAPVELTEYEGQHGLIEAGAAVAYDNPALPSLGSPAPDGEPLVVAALYEFGLLNMAGRGGRWVLAVLNGGAYECSADNLRPLAREETLMNHDDCVPAGQFTTPRTHTHEGQVGAWLFPGEATERDLALARASGWVPPAERPHPPGRPLAPREENS